MRNWYTRLPVCTDERAKVMHSYDFCLLVVVIWKDFLDEILEVNGFKLYVEGEAFETMGSQSETKFF